MEATENAWERNRLCLVYIAAGRGRGSKEAKVDDAICKTFADEKVTHAASRCAHFQDNFSVAFCEINVTKRRSGAVIQDPLLKQLPRVGPSFAATYDSGCFALGVRAPLRRERFRFAVRMHPRLRVLPRLISPSYPFAIAPTFWAQATLN